jgi:F-type H+-transporting ATPase subunit b
MVLFDSTLIKPEPGLMIWTLVTFVAVLFVLRRWAFGPIQQTIEARRRAIAENLEAAEKARAEAERLSREHREAIAESRREAARIVEDARRAAETREQQAAAALDEEMGRRMERARAEIAAETRQSLAAIKEQIAELTVATTEKVVRRRLDEAEQRRLIDEALPDVDLSAFAEAQEGER